jgi:hypothetical protein
VGWDEKRAREPISFTLINLSLHHNFFDLSVRNISMSHSTVATQDVTNLVHNGETGTPASRR